MNILEKFEQIACFVFDVDGVLTDGKVTLMPNGSLVRNMNIKDGYAIQLAIKKGYNIVIISGGASVEVEERLKKLGVKNIFMKTTDKKTVLLDWLEENQMKKENTLYMGDDIPDIAAMQAVGLPCCPQDAVAQVQNLSLYIAPQTGGNGCVRDVIEKTMTLRNDWNEDFTIKAM